MNESSTRLWPRSCFAGVDALLLVLGLVFATCVRAQEFYWFSTLAGMPATGHQDGPAAQARFSLLAGAVADAAGNLYVSDMGNHVIRRITSSGVVSTYAGTPGWPGAADGYRTSARFNMPRDLALDAAGNLYVADSGNHTIRRVTPGGSVSTWAGSPGEAGTADGLRASARFNTPTGVAVEALGNLYVADMYNHTIRVVGSTGIVSTLAGQAGAMGSGDGLGAAARFANPHSVAVGSDGAVYIADGNNRVVRRMTPAGDVTSYAGSAIPSPTPVDGIGAAARFGYIVGLTADAAGNLYVIDGSGTIRQIAPGAVVTTIAGTSGVSGYRDGIGAAAQFNISSIGGIAAGPGGDVFVADHRNLVVRRLAAVGADWAVTTLAGTPSLPGSVDGTGAAARFTFVQGVVVDGNGTILLTDGSAIRKISPAGQVTTWAGSAEEPGYADGPGLAARFAEPSGLAIDGGGNVLVADSNNSVIRRITPQGDVSLYAGAVGVRRTEDGPLSTASFAIPRGIAVDGAGNIYVAEAGSSGGGRIRQISPTTGMVTTLAGGGGTGQSRDGIGELAAFNNPWALAFDNGGVLVAERSVGKLRRVDLATREVTTLFAADPSSLICGLARDPAGNCYLALTSSNVLVRYGTDAALTTLGGFVGVTGSTDGVGQYARFAGPFGVAIDATGALIIADSTNRTVRRGVRTDASGMVAFLADAVQQTDLPRGLARSLLATLRAAEHLLADHNRRNDRAAIVLLRVFRQEVRLHASHGIDAASANHLANLATQLIAALESAPRAPR